MPSVDLTPEKLADIKQKASDTDCKNWRIFHQSEGCSILAGRNIKIASAEYLEDATHIAAADPATVLAMVEEIETLKTALNLLMWDYWGTDLEQDNIDDLCKKQIEMAKKYRNESEAGQ